MASRRKSPASANDNISATLLITIATITYNAINIDTHNVIGDFDKIIKWSKLWHNAATFVTVAATGDDDFDDDDDDDDDDDEDDCRLSDLRCDLHFRLLWPLLLT